jgi:hypothetical protein
MGKLATLSQIEGRPRDSYFTGIGSSRFKYFNRSNPLLASSAATRGSTRGLNRLNALNR